MRFDAKEYLESKLSDIRKVLRPEESDKVLAACSGGVDSTVSAVLVARALGRPIRAVYIDDGLRRKGEPERVLSVLNELGLSAFIYDAKKDVLEALKGKIDAEEKRKAFRDAFYTVLGRIIREMGAEYLVQGTIAADIVETVGGIKTQHNVLEELGIADKYGFKLIEPIKDLYKPQVRMLARELGLPAEICDRKPFPGPGLAIRIVGEVTWEKLELLRRVTEIVEEETSDIESFQSFAVLLDMKATGIRDGKRVYGYIVALRIVSSEDAMRAKFVEVPHGRLRRISTRIVSEVPEVSRVLYDITDKPPATIEFE
ncbi:ExsB family transcriptional regulator [Candidatus Korarchaeum cryptofilum]|uniref:GMP synthase (glutamine-hydrolyzing) n=1 Tax=Candidatus Korarchaeum cryptofilum TaxID=498846 RepID=A0A3R9Q8Z7_9CREN|nr:ATP-binding protein [Candidatus Korarchaeum cryptofilum]RSN68717.1 ExsB family transcriptional regulator [Candidatus Korarchaeum cryptofilum]